MNSRNAGVMWVIVVVLLVVIVVLGYFLVATPAPSSGTQATTTTEGTGTNTGNTGGISDVTVTAPKSGATVPKSFTVTGQAPGSWFFEATFPLEVRDPSGAVVGTGHATALSDWMTTDQVPFTADITVSGYSGPATLVLKKDNPSGLPQNDGSMTVPITIQ